MLLHSWGTQKGANPAKKPLDEPYADKFNGPLSRALPPQGPPFIALPKSA